MATPSSGQTSHGATLQGEEVEVLLPRDNHSNNQNNAAGTQNNQDSLLDAPGSSHTSNANATWKNSLSKEPRGSSSGYTSDSSDSAGSLGGLNHVNDGVGRRSTAHRRMSRVYSIGNLPSPITTKGGHHGQHALSSSVEEDGLGSPGVVVVTSPRYSAAYDPGTHPLSPRRISYYGGPAGSVALETGTDLDAVHESCWKRWLRRRLPIFGWLISPGYQMQDLPDDIIAGITLSTVLVPQAMAYAMLAPLPPVYGLYTSIVPVLIYCIFGTSRHMHTGTFAITTLLLGQAVRELMASQSNAGGNDDMMQSLWSTISSSPTPTFEFNPDEDLRFIGMILLLSFVVGVIQVVLSFIGAGQWASKHLLPDSLVGGFNTAAVFHIGTSQLKHFLGIKNVPASKGAFALIKTWIWLGTNMWTQSNWYTVALGVLAIVMMTVMRFWEKARKTRHEQEQRRIEMKLVQERQALSEAITRVREEQRRQQELYQQQQQQQQYHQGTHRPYGATNASSQAASNISLSTMANVPAFNTASRHTPSEAEQALTTALNESNVANKLDDLVVAPQQSIYIPIPDILFSVIILTVLTVIFSWDRPRSEGGFGIDVIGDIPKGLPQMAFPPNLIAPGGPKEWMTWEFVHDVILPMLRPALLIAFVVYVMSFSIAKQFGKKYGYKVDANQEMLALGLASMGGSCFSGYACTGSLTRTAILSQSGGKTPLASLVGVVVVVLTLVCLTWCFERVPNAVLAAIVLVALQSLIAQIYEPFKLWKVEDRKVDAVIWVLTFLGVWVISVEIGIFIGIIAVVSVKLFMQIQKWMHPELAYAGNQRKRRSRRYSRDGSNRRRSVATPLLDDEDRARDSGDEYDDGESPLSPRQQRRLSTLSRNARRRTPSSSVLDPGSRASREAANWKQRLLQTKWGQQIGSWFGVERPFLADSIHTHTDEDDY